MQWERMLKNGLWRNELEKWKNIGCLNERKRVSFVHFKANSNKIIDRRMRMSRILYREYTFIQCWMHKCICFIVWLLAGWLAVLPVRLLLILMMVYLIVWVCFFLIRPIQFYCSRHSQACLGKECAAHMALSHHFNSHFIHTVLRLQNLFQPHNYYYY